MTPPIALTSDEMKDLRDKVNRDEQSRDLWVQRQAHFLLRRFSAESTSQKFPWPGASRITMPTLDTAIRRLKSSYVQSTLGADPPVTVRGETPDSVRREASVERRLKHLIDVRMEASEKEVDLAADLYLQHGHVTIGLAYDRRTRIAREVIHRDRLPGPLAELVGKNPLDDDQANLAFRLTGRPRLSQRDIEDGEPEIRRLLRFHYGLDPSVKADRATEDSIFKWLVSGKSEPLTIKRREVYRDTPTFFACLPEDLIVNSSTLNEQDAARVTMRRRIPVQRFFQEAEDAGWDKRAVAEFKQARELGSGVSTIVRFDYLTQTRHFVHTRLPSVTGRFGLDSREQVEVLTTFFWHDVDRDGQAERCVCVWTPSIERPLKVYELPFDFYEWPIVQIKREHVSRGWYNSRGIPEVLDQLDREITEQHRQKLNSMAIANAPTFKARINSGLAAQTNQWIPGQYHWVQRMDDLEPLQVPTSQVSYEREEQILSGWVERLAGIFDSSLTDQGRLTRPRTATEISGVTSLQEQSVGADLLIWHRGWARVFRMLWALDLQYGPDELWIRVAGDEAPIRQTRHEIQGQFDFQPVPAALQSPVLRLQKAQLVANLLIQTTQVGVDFGDEVEVRPAEVFRLILREIDPRIADLAIRRLTPEEVAARRQAQAQSQGPATLPPQALEGPPGQVAGRVQQALAAGQEGGVPIEVNGVGGFI